MGLWRPKGAPGGVAENKSRNWGSKSGKCQKNKKTLKSGAQERVALQLGGEKTKLTWLVGDQSEEGKKAFYRRPAWDGG